MSAEQYRVWAIQYDDGDNVRVVGVSAESEYGAVKRLVGSRRCVVLAVKLTDRTPQYDQRRIEGFIHGIEWTLEDRGWMYR